MARANGLCNEWFGSWGDDDTIDMCLDRYVRGFDFAVNNDYPSLDFIRRNFKDEDLLRHHVYLDKVAEVDAMQSGYYIFLGDSDCCLVADGFIAVTVYCRHNSRIDVRAINGARVFVTYYDDSGGDCYQDDYSKCKKYIRKRVAK